MRIICPTCGTANDSAATNRCLNCGTALQSTLMSVPHVDGCVSKIRYVRVAKKRPLRSGPKVCVKRTGRRVATDPLMDAVAAYITDHTKRKMGDQLTQIRDCAARLMKVDIVESPVHHGKRFMILCRGS